MAKGGRPGGPGQHVFFRPGARQVLRDNLGVQGHDQVTVVHASIQPVHESRAIRPWEEMAEGIIPFTMCELQGATAAEFSGAALALPASVPGEDRDVFAIIDAVHGSTNIFMTLSAHSSFDATLSTAGRVVVYRDGRMGQDTRPVPLLEHYGGSDPTGINAPHWHSGVNIIAEPVWFIIRPGQGLLVYCTTVNTACTISISGRLFLPNRQR